MHVYGNAYIGGLTVKAAPRIYSRMIPSAVALVTSGSRGNRLLFYHTGANAEGEEFILYK
jgi:hypothetical protein